MLPDDSRTSTYRAALTAANDTYAATMIDADKAARGARVVAMARPVPADRTAALAAMNAAYREIEATAGAAYDAAARAADAAFAASA